MKPHLLIAESDRKAAVVLHEFLTRRGYRVEIAVGGVDCLEKLRSFLPELLILSSDLPWGGSEGILELLREAKEVPVVSVVLLGKLGSPTKHATTFGPPIVKYVPEPISPAKLYDVLEKHSAAQKHSKNNSTVTTPPHRSATHQPVPQFTSGTLVAAHAARTCPS